MKSLLFILRGDDTLPSCRFRAYQFEPFLKKLGVEVNYLLIEKSKNIFKQLIFHHKLFWKSKKYDAVIYQKLIEPYRLKLVRLANKNLFFDFDDAMYITEGESKFKHALQAVPNVIAGNPILAAHAKKYNSNVTVIPTTVLKGSNYPSEKPTQIIISWMGTSSNLKYLIPIYKALDKLNELGFLFYLNVLTDIPDKVKTREWIQVEKWSISKEKEILKSCTFGLMPLSNDPWSEGKCACKALQYLSYNKPVLSSPVGINEKIFSNENLGVLVKENNWREGVNKIIHNIDKGFYSNSKRFEFINKNYTTEIWAAPLNDLLFKELMQ